MHQLQLDVGNAIRVYEKPYACQSMTGPRDYVLVTVTLNDVIICQMDSGGVPTARKEIRAIAEALAKALNVDVHTS